MALIQCPECKKQISDTAESCPQCGYKFTPGQAEEIKAKSLKNNTIQNIFLLLVGIISIFIIGYCSMDSPKEKIVKSDRELYLDFYNDLIGKITTFENKYSLFIKAASYGKYIDAINIATDIEPEINQMQNKIGEIKIPEFKDEKARSELREARQLLKNCYLNQWSIIYHFIEYSKSPSPYNLAQIKKEVSMSRAQHDVGMVKLVATGLSLGVKAEELKLR